MSPTPTTSGIDLGVYEKALLWTGSWPALFTQVADAGFAFIDLSVDETPDRSARLDWPQEERRRVRCAAATQGIAIGGVCLSVHRLVAPGSADPEVREHAREILLKAVDLCVDLGVPVLQLAGYFAFYEQAHANARAYYVQTLRAGVDYAARRGVMLGIENVDGTDITSITKALEVCDEIGSVYLQLYPDIGNLAEQQLDVVRELAAGEGRMLAIHVKETRPGEPRRVPMGEGVVPWDDAFSELARQGWSGRIMIEMWNDSRPDSAELAQRARGFIVDHLKAHGLRVIEHGRRADGCKAVTGDGSGREDADRTA